MYPMRIGRVVWGGTRQASFECTGGQKGRKLHAQVWGGERGLSALDVIIHQLGMRTWGSTRTTETPKWEEKIPLQTAAATVHEKKQNINKREAGEKIDGIAASTDK